MPIKGREQKMTYGYKDTARYAIQWDNASKRFPFRVLTISGICLAYFRTQADAVAFCEV